MKCLIPILGLLGFAILGQAADDLAAIDPRMAGTSAAIATNGVKWIDGTELPIEGRAFSDTERPYDRLPAEVSTNVNRGVRSLKHETAGLRLAFVTDSRRIHLRWMPSAPRRNMDNMPATGHSAFDLYARGKDGVWRYRKTARIPALQKGGSFATDWTPGVPCLVYFPLYNGLSWFKLGVDETADIRPLPPRAGGETRPVVFYGTSITQGGCASRPGMSFVNVIGRDLDVPVVNLGFAGSGRMEIEMADLLARIDASCYVLDCLWNMNSALVAARYEPFIRRLRERRPDVPIVMAEKGDVFNGPPTYLNGRVRKLHDTLRAEGWRRLVYLPADGMFAKDGEGTVDGCHPNDWGMMAMAKAYGGAVREALASGRTTVPESRDIGGRTYRLVWNDEFDGREIDRTKWDVPTQFRQGASLWHPENVWLTNGVAHFDIRRESSPTVRYASACLRTRKRAVWPDEKAVDLFSFTYGYAEVRCRLPKELRCDYWAAFWLQSLGMSGATTDDSRQELEVDVFETFSRWKPGHKCNAAFHWGGYREHHGHVNFVPGGPSLADDGWHIFGVLWTPDEYVFTVDGVETLRTDLKGLKPSQPTAAPSCGVLSTPAYLKLSCEAKAAMGPSPDFERPAPLRDAFEVDYIRVYQEDKRKENHEDH